MRATDVNDEGFHSPGDAEFGQSVRRAQRAGKSFSLFDRLGPVLLAGNQFEYHAFLQIRVHLHRITQYYLDRYQARWGRRECTMHDALALGIAADPSLALRAPKVRVDVELTGSHTRGMTVGDFRPWTSPEQGNVTVVLEVDSQRFIERWLEVLSRQ